MKRFTYKSRRLTLAAKSPSGKSFNWLLPKYLPSEKLQPPLLASLTNHNANWEDNEVW